MAVLMQDLKKQINDIIYSSALEARKKKEALSPAHLFYTCLQERLKQQAQPRLEKAAEKINSSIIVKTKLQDISADRIDSTFNTEEAVASCIDFLEQHNYSGSIYNGLLWWLMDNNYDDDFGLAAACNRILQTHGISAALTVSGETQPSIEELGFGLEVDGHNFPGFGRDDFFIGRDNELEKHLGFLQIAIDQNQHYLLEGAKGVGKSSFILHLLCLALQRFAKSTDPQLTTIRFILFQTNDFIGSEQQIAERFTDLVHYLQLHPQVIPVFDGLEYILNPALTIQESFISCFGSVIYGGGRTYIFTSLSSVAEKSDILKNINRQILPPLSKDTHLALIKHSLNYFLKETPVIHKIENGIETYCSYIAGQAYDRYPEKCFPILGISLTQNAVLRAKNRILFLNKEPHALIEKDLWEYIAEDLSLDTELLGSDPDEFYRNLPIHLKGEVIGQDHAIDTICSALADQRLLPPSKIPRARFMFVGPPGIGKTQLARSLATQLGYSQEAFFMLNMSEYSAESARTRFMGSDPGYIGYGKTQTIYDMVKSRPSCVILLDEIDRSHSSIQDILLSILEGQGKNAEGEMVSFSQAIFILTTNQGQEQVEKAYYNAKTDNCSRESIIKNFTDDNLRSLLLKGVIDDSEANMKEFLEFQIQQAQSHFCATNYKNSQTSDDLVVKQENIDHIQNYLSLKQLHEGLHRKTAKTPLDRALLDRVDFVIPFFPIKEKNYIDKIIGFKLKQMAWPDCSDKIKNKIASLVMAPEGSIRMVERLIKKYRLKTNKKND